MSDECQKERDLPWQLFALLTTPDRIDRALVDEIASYGVYAPTNNYELRAIVVADPAITEALDAIDV